jgi:hypothetical protein
VDIVNGTLCPTKECVGLFIAGRWNRPSAFSLHPEATSRISLGLMISLVAADTGELEGEGFSFLDTSWVFLGGGFEGEF